MRSWGGSLCWRSRSIYWYKKPSCFIWKSCVSIFFPLQTEYEDGNDRVASLLNHSDIHILPTLNPDGFERSQLGVCRGYNHASGRTNDAGVDLNRDFPDWDMEKEGREKLLEGRAPETKAAIRWILGEIFRLASK